MLKAFGPFAIVFEPMGYDTTPYLTLLHLHDQRSSDVIRTIRDLATDDSVTHVVTLLRDDNWRPHLIGAIAAFYKTTTEAVAQLWRAVDAGSWVTPQLTGILSRIDNEFTSKAVVRLMKLCPIIDDPEYSIQSPLEKHSAQGPAGSNHRSAKSATSLLALLDENEIAQFYANENLHALIRNDYDGSADIAISWMEKFLELDSQL